MFIESSCTALQDAMTKLNDTIENTTVYAWNNKSDFDAIRGILTDDVNQRIDEMIDNRQNRILTNALTTFFVDIGFDNTMAEAKARDAYYALIRS